MPAKRLVQTVNGNLKTIGFVLAVVLALGPGWFWAGAKSGQINDLAADRVEDLARQTETDRTQDARLDTALELLRAALSELDGNVDALREDLHRQNAIIARLITRLENSN